jgi:hypothetical protein
VNTLLLVLCFGGVLSFTVALFGFGLGPTTHGTYFKALITSGAAGALCYWYATTGTPMLFLASVFYVLAAAVRIVDLGIRFRRK